VADRDEEAGAGQAALQLGLGRMQTCLAKRGCLGSHAILDQPSRPSLASTIEVLVRRRGRSIKLATSHCGKSCWRLTMLSARYGSIRRVDARPASVHAAESPQGAGTDAPSRLPSRGWPARVIRSYLRAGSLSLRLPDLD